ncbi:hypothetical protein ACOMHN_028429 [Nucella lapillus]
MPSKYKEANRDKRPKQTERESRVSVSRVNRGKPAIHTEMKRDKRPKLKDLRHPFPPPSEVTEEQAMKGPPFDTVNTSLNVLEQAMELPDGQLNLKRREYLEDIATAVQRVEKVRDDCKVLISTSDCLKALKDLYEQTGEVPSNFFMMYLGEMYRPKHVQRDLVPARARSPVGLKHSRQQIPGKHMERMDEEIMRLQRVLFNRFTQDIHQFSDKCRLRLVMLNDVSDWLNGQQRILNDHLNMFCDAWYVFEDEDSLGLYQRLQNFMNYLEKAVHQTRTLAGYLFGLGVTDPEMSQKKEKKAKISSIKLSTAQIPTAGVMLKNKDRFIWSVKKVNSILQFCNQMSSNPQTKKTLECGLELFNNMMQVVDQNFEKLEQADQSMAFLHKKLAETCQILEDGTSKLAVVKKEQQTLSGKQQVLTHKLSKVRLENDVLERKLDHLGTMLTSLHEEEPKPMTEEEPKAMSKEEPKALSEETSSEMGDEKTQAVPEKKTSAVPEEKPQAVPEEKPYGTPDTPSISTSGILSQEVSPMSRLLGKKKESVITDTTASLRGEIEFYKDAVCHLKYKIDKLRTYAAKLEHEIGPLAQDVRKHYYPKRDEVTLEALKNADLMVKERRLSEIENLTLPPHITQFMSLAAAENLKMIEIPGTVPSPPVASTGDETVATEPEPSQEPTEAGAELPAPESSISILSVPETPEPPTTPHSEPKVISETSLKPHQKEKIQATSVPSRPELESSLKTSDVEVLVTSDETHQEMLASEPAAQTQLKETVPQIPKQLTERMQHGSTSQTKLSEKSSSLGKVVDISPTTPQPKETPISTAPRSAPPVRFLDSEPKMDTERPAKDVSKMAEESRKRGTLKSSVSKSIEDYKEEDTVKPFEDNKEEEIVKSIEDYKEEDTVKPFEDYQEEDIWKSIEDYKEETVRSVEDYQEETAVKHIEDYKEETVKPIEDYKEKTVRSVKDYQEEETAVKPIEDYKEETVKPIEDYKEETVKSIEDYKEEETVKSIEDYKEETVKSIEDYKEEETIKPIEDYKEETVKSIEDYKEEETVKSIEDYKEETVKSIEDYEEEETVKSIEDYKEETVKPIEDYKEETVKSIEDYKEEETVKSIEDYKEETVKSIEDYEEEETVKSIEDYKEETVKPIEDYKEETVKPIEDYKEETVKPIEDYKEETVKPIEDYKEETVKSIEDYEEEETVKSIEDYKEETVKPIEDYKEETVKPIEDYKEETVKPIEDYKEETVKPIEDYKEETVKPIEDYKEETVKPIEDYKEETVKPIEDYKEDETVKSIEDYKEEETVRSVEDYKEEDIVKTAAEAKSEGSLETAEDDKEKESLKTSTVPERKESLETIEKLEENETFETAKEHKEEDSLKAVEEHKEDDTLKTAEEHKEDDTLKTVEEHKEDDTLKTAEEHKELKKQETLKTVEKHKEEEEETLKTVTKPDSKETLRTTKIHKEEEDASETPGKYKEEEETSKTAERHKEKETLRTVTKPESKKTLKTTEKNREEEDSLENAKKHKKEAVKVDKEHKEPKKQETLKTAEKHKEEEEALKTTGKPKEEETMKTAGKHKEEETMKTAGKHKEEETMKTAEKYKEEETMKTAGKHKEEETMKTAEKYKEEETMKTAEKHKEEETMKTAGKHKEEETMKTAEKYKEEETMKTAEKHKKEETMKTAEKHKEEETMKTAGKHKEEETMKTAEKYKEEETIKTAEKQEERETLETTTKQERSEALRTDPEHKEKETLKTIVKTKRQETVEEDKEKETLETIAEPRRQEALGSDEEHKDEETLKAVTEPERKDTSKTVEEDQEKKTSKTLVQPERQETVDTAAERKEKETFITVTEPGKLETVKEETVIEPERKGSLKTVHKEEKTSRTLIQPRKEESDLKTIEHKEIDTLATSTERRTQGTSKTIIKPKGQSSKSNVEDKGKETLQKRSDTLRTAEVPKQTKSLKSVTELKRPQSSKASAEPKAKDTVLEIAVEPNRTESLRMQAPSRTKFKPGVKQSKESVLKEPPKMSSSLSIVSKGRGKDAEKLKEDDKLHKQKLQQRPHGADTDSKTPRYASSEKDLHLGENVFSDLSSAEESKEIKGCTCPFCMQSKGGMSTHVLSLDMTEEPNIDIHAVCLHILHQFLSLGYNLAHVFSNHQLKDLAESARQAHNSLADLIQTEDYDVLQGLAEAVQTYFERLQTLIQKAMSGIDTRKAEERILNMRQEKIQELNQKTATLQAKQNSLEEQYHNLWFMHLALCQAVLNKRQNRPYTYVYEEATFNETPVTAVEDNLKLPRGIIQANQTILTEAFRDNKISEKCLEKGHECLDALDTVYNGHLPFLVRLLTIGQRLAEVEQLTTGQCQEHAEDPAACQRWRNWCTTMTSRLRCQFQHLLIELHRWRTEKPKIIFKSWFLFNQVLLETGVRLVCPQPSTASAEESTRLYFFKMAKELARRKSLPLITPDNYQELVAAGKLPVSSAKRSSLGCGSDNTLHLDTRQSVTSAVSPQGFSVKKSHNKDGPQGRLAARADEALSESQVQRRMQFNRSSSIEECLEEVADETD